MLCLTCTTVLADTLLLHSDTDLCLLPIDKTKLIEVAVDSNEQWLFEDLRLRKFEDQFVPWQKEEHLCPKYAHWGKINIKSLVDQKAYLYFGKAEHILVYALHEDGQIEQKSIGEFTKRSDLDVKKITKSAYISFPKDEVVTIFVKLKNETNFLPRFSLKLFSPEEFWDSVIFKPLFKQGLFQGTLFLLIFYALVLFVMMRDKAYLFFSLYIGVLIVSFFIHDQLHYHFFSFLAEFPKTMYFIEILTGQLALLSFFLFMRFFLDTPTLIPRWNTFMMTWLGIRFFSLPIFIWVNTYIFEGDFLLFLFFFFELLLLIITSVLLYFTRDRLARYFIIGTLILGIFGIMTVLGWLNILNINYVEHLLQVGIVGQVICFSIGLGYRTSKNANLVDELTVKNEDLVSELETRVQEQEQTLRLFMRYVPKPVIDKALQSTGDSIFDGEQRSVTVLFCDIRDFTSLSEGLAPREAVAMLNEFYGLMTKSIQKHGGTVNQFIGDEVLAVFGAPLATTNNERRAVLAAMDMIKQVDELNKLYRSKNIKEIAIGIGINAGEVVAGNVGSEAKIVYTVIGDTVNTGKRIESLTKHHPNSIFISQNVFEKVNGLIEGIPNEPISVKGKKEKMFTYRVVTN